MEISTIPDEIIDHPDTHRLAIWLDNLGYEVGGIDELQRLADEEQEHFIGEYDGNLAFVHDYVWEAYGPEIDALPSFIKDCLDWEGMWNGWFRYDFTDHPTPQGNVYIWHNH